MQEKADIYCEFKIQFDHTKATEELTTGNEATVIDTVLFL